MPPTWGSTSAASPIHRTTLVGSMKYSKTTSGGAAIRISRTTCPGSPARGSRSATAPPPLPTFVPLDGALQRLQAAFPVAVQPLPDLGDPFGPGAVQAARSDPPLGHQVRLLQHAAKLGDGGAGDVEVRGDLAG